MIFRGRTYSFHIKRSCAMIKIKRVYEEIDSADGQRILVDRLWPRGVGKARAQIDLWLKDLAPSNDLRLWYAHEPQRWPRFQEHYLLELQEPGKALILKDLLNKAKDGNVTLIYATHDNERNNAVILKKFLEQCLGPANRRTCQGKGETMGNNAANIGK
jgi:uncharacterized protein YeaO (DUF488 family)